MIQYCMIDIPKYEMIVITICKSFLDLNIRNNTINTISGQRFLVTLSWQSLEK